MLVSEWNMDVALKVRGEEENLKARMEIAKKLKDRGLSVEDIAADTGLTVDDILRL